MDFEEKVLKAKKGDDNAFYEIVSSEKAILYKMAYSYVKNKDDAVDIVSDTVYKAYISISKLKEPAFFKSWLIRILINSAIDFIKKSKKVLLLDEKINIVTAEEDSEYTMDLYSAVDRLDEKCRTTVILKYFQDMTLKQVAEVMECPLGTVKTYLHRALASLKLDIASEEELY